MKWIWFHYENYTICRFVTNKVLFWMKKSTSLSSIGRLFPSKWYRMMWQSLTIKAFDHRWMKKNILRLTWPYDSYIRLHIIATTASHSVFVFIFPVENRLFDFVFQASNFVRKQTSQNANNTVLKRVYVSSACISNGRISIFIFLLKYYEKFRNDIDRQPNDDSCFLLLFYSYSSIFLLLDTFFSLLIMFHQNFVLPTVNKGIIITSDDFYLNIFYHSFEMKTKKLTGKFDSISMWFYIDSPNWNNRVPFQWIQFKICAQVSIEWQKEHKLYCIMVNVLQSTQLGRFYF